MSQNVFISFLGTNRYLECKYTQEDFYSGYTRYIQVALLEYLNHINIKIDRVITFVTQEAFDNNYCPDGPPYVYKKEKNVGLQADLGKLISADKLDHKFIPPGFSEDQVWQQFKKVYDQFNPEDNIYLDVTHAFRHIPMLGLVLSNFSSLTKRTTLKGIYYGAFEKLGPGHKVENIPLKNRVAPIIDLYNLYELQQWTLATHNFIMYGNPKELIPLGSMELRPVLRNDDTRTSQIQQLNTSLNQIKILYDNIVSVRYTALENERIIHQVISGLQDYVDSSDSIVPVFDTMIRTILTKIESLAQQNLPLWLRLSQWCYDYKYYQQAITYLREGIITYLDREIIYESVPRHEKRELLSSSLQHGRKAKSEWNEKLKTHETLVLKVVNHSLYPDLEKIYRNISNIRNDINHAGHNDTPTSPKGLANFLSHTLQDLKVIFQGESQMAQKDIELPENSVSQSKNSKILLNFSNHPSECWLPEQIERAHSLWSEVHDLAFPFVPPDIGNRELDSMVAEYGQKIIEMKPATVHIMGELTFTHRMVSLLKDHDIECIASTTDRNVNVQKGGIKVSKFEFVNFRKF